MAYDPNNIFAKILRKELPCVKVYEDDLTVAFMDIMPAVEGHTLVITKEAAEGILDLSPEGAAAGQTIPHIHFHILPRAEGADLRFHGRTMVKPEVLETVAARIRAALA
jgi:histidine triad (HIT) family protein